MKKLSQTLLIVLLFTAGLANAQNGTDSYEYATVVYGGLSTGGKSIIVYVSLSNGEFNQVELENNGGKATPNFNQAVELKYIAQMTKDGWEAINFQVDNDPMGKRWIYFLKRKQK